MCRREDSGYQPSMDVLTLLLLIAGLVCFIIAALKKDMKFDLVAVGLACWIATAILARF